MTTDQRIEAVAEAMCPTAFQHTTRPGIAAALQNSRADNALYFAEVLLSTNGVTPITEDALRAALDEAEGWAEFGYTEHSKAYWEGMRDTLRVVLGITTEIPSGSQQDTAAYSIIGANQRLASKAVRR